MEAEHCDDEEIEGAFARTITTVEYEHRFVEHEYGGKPYEPQCVSIG